MNVTTYSSKRNAVRALKAIGIVEDNCETFLVKEPDGKWGFDKEAAEKSLGITGLSEADQDLVLTCGYHECPECGINLSNGIGDFDGLTDMLGSFEAAYKNQKHEWACLACNAEWGNEITPPAKPGARKPRADGEPRAPYAQSVEGMRDSKEFSFNYLNENPETKRKDWVEYAVGMGITLNTARAQFQHWRKSKGLVKAKDAPVPVEEPTDTDDTPTEEIDTPVEPTEELEPVTQEDEELEEELEYEVYQPTEEELIADELTALADREEEDAAE